MAIGSGNSGVLSDLLQLVDALFFAFIISAFVVFFSPTRLYFSVVISLNAVTCICNFVPPIWPFSSSLTDCSVLSASVCQQAFNVRAVSVNSLLANFLSLRHTRCPLATRCRCVFVEQFHRVDVCLPSFIPLEGRSRQRRLRL